MPTMIHKLLDTVPWCFVARSVCPRKVPCYPKKSIGFSPHCLSINCNFGASYALFDYLLFVIPHQFVMRESINIVLIVRDSIERFRAVYTLNLNLTSAESLYLSLPGKKAS